MKVISAKEANTKTFEVINSYATEELDEIMNNIQNEINKGSFCYVGDGYLYEDTKKRLKELGYKVEIVSQYNEPYYSIKWGECITCFGFKNPQLNLNILLMTLWVVT